MAPEGCEGWTMVLLDRASRFLWALQGGRKNRKLFRRAIRALVRVVNVTKDLTLITDSEHGSWAGVV